MRLGYGWKGLEILGVITLLIFIYGASLEGEQRVTTLDSSISFFKLWLFLFVILLISKTYKYIRYYLHKKGFVNYIDKSGTNDDKIGVSIKRVLIGVLIVIGIPIFISIIYALLG